MIPFNQLKPLHDLLADEINAALLRVADSGWYILGPEVEAFEREFAAYHGVSHAVGVANGTDAIELALRAGGDRRGRRKSSLWRTPPWPAVAAIEATGATCPYWLILIPRLSPCAPMRRAQPSRSAPVAIVAVHLYGGAADTGFAGGVGAGA